MNIWHKLLREHTLWRHFRTDRLRWIVREHHNALTTRTFRLGAVDYPYFIHPYNHTWANERAVEIPYARAFLSCASSSLTLEIGNVMSHYFDSGHTVIDKWEKCRYRPVVNQDLLEFESKRQFDLILSISTIEHVGWDESPRREKSVITALRKIQSLLSPIGKALVTIPVGYNHYLDQRLPELLNALVTVECLKRISHDNQWGEVDLGEALKCKYDVPFSNANSIIFLQICANPNKTLD